MKPIECTSEEGITIGLIDTIINSATLLHERYIMCKLTKGVKEALKDLES